jgi:hypothetical protein
MKLPPSWIVPAAAAVVALVVGSLAYQHFANRGVSPAVRDSIAVLKASKAPDSIAHAQLVAAANTVYVASVALSARATAAEARATQSEARARSLAQAASQAASARDSATLYHQAYEEEQRRGDSLEAALALERRASESARASALTFQRADSASQARLARVERLNVDLTAELQRVSGGCRLFPGVSCPSRKVTAAGAALLTYVVVRRTRI